jgi:hypothetical protein
MTVTSKIPKGLPHKHIHSWLPNDSSRSLLLFTAVRVSSFRRRQKPVRTLKITVDAEKLPALPNTMSKPLPKAPFTGVAKAISEHHDTAALSRQNSMAF